MYIESCLLKASGWIRQIGLAEKVTLQRAFLQSASFSYCYHVYRFGQGNIDGIIIFDGLIDLIHLLCCYLIRWNHEGCNISQRIPLKYKWSFELLIWTWITCVFQTHWFPWRTIISFLLRLIFSQPWTASQPAFQKGILWLPYGKQSMKVFSLVTFLPSNCRDLQLEATVNLKTIMYLTV